MLNAVLRPASTSCQNYAILDENNFVETSDKTKHFNFENKSGTTDFELTAFSL